MPMLFKLIGWFPRHPRSQGSLFLRNHGLEVIIRLSAPRRAIRPEAAPLLAQATSSPPALLHRSFDWCRLQCLACENSATLELSLFLQHVADRTDSQRPPRRYLVCRLLLEKKKHTCR